MDELRGPNIQIVLHVKEGLGFGFLRTPFVVSGSLNGYMLETDPVVPSHAPVFDAELVWEADKRRFRSLRVQNVPVKVEVFSMGTQGRKDKIGYLLLSLLGAQPCPSNKIIDVKYTWHRLLGVKSEGKCCQPQLMMSLTVEDRVNTPTPRNELRMFHSNEIAYPSADAAKDPPSARNILLTLNEYIAESKKTVSTLDLIPKLLCDEGLIQIGDGKHHFVLSFVIGSVENLDMLLPETSTTKEIDCYVTYSVFTHNIMTDRVGATPSGSGVSAYFNQRTSLRIASQLSALGRYFSECPYVVAKVCAGDSDIGICSMDLRKLVPTEDPKQFVERFCNLDRALTIHERCFILPCDVTRGRVDAHRRPHVDVEMTLKYVGLKETQETCLCSVESVERGFEIFEHEFDVKKPPILTARSATHLESDRKREPLPKDDILEYKSGSCTNLDQDVGGVGYTNMGTRNTARYKNASGDSILQTNEIAELIKKMCDSFTQSQEKLLATRLKPITSDMQIQCEPERDGDIVSEKGDNVSPRIHVSPKKNLEDLEREPVKLETSKSDTCIGPEKERVKLVLPFKDRDEIIQKFVDELEDWKEKQQELFKYQLKRKEEYHLDLLSKEWNKKRIELEMKLSKGIEQCRNLAADLSRATEDFRLRGYRNTERERKLLEAKKGLEAHYTAKYQELREASQKMEDDMNHRLKMKDMAIEEQNLKIMHLEKQIDILKNNMKNSEKEAESKYSGLTKDQTASLIQELRCLEEKLDSAVQSKSFFKEQWGRAVRELHLIKLSNRKQMLTQLQQDRRQLGEMGLDTIDDRDESNSTNPIDIKKLKDDFYVDLLANTPALESHSIINDSRPEALDLYDLKNAPKNPMNDKLNELISQRDKLIHQDNPDEELLKQLNHDIRNLLLNYGH